MLNLKYCTITGLDEKTDLVKLVELTKRYPFVEWGVLFRKDPNGRPRYPTFEYIKKLVEIKKDFNIRMAIHMCRSSVEDVVLSHLQFSFLKNFDRIQLNFAYNDVAFTIHELFEFIEDCKVNWNTPVITQHNADNINVTRLLESTHHHVLFDTSRGTGQLLEPPLYIENKFCGYAGGIGPDNLNEIIPLIETASNGHETWIDMESSVRTDNWLDLDKVQSVLDQISKHPLINL